MAKKNPESVYEYVETDRIIPNPDNPRKNIGDLQELKDSIKAFGILQNLTVTTESEQEKYVVVCGHRRLAAAQEIGLKAVPCAIVKEMPKKDQIAMMLQENMQRGDLNYQEEAQAFQMMLNLGETIKEIVKKTGLSETKVRHRVKLNELDQDALEKAMARNITINELILLEKIKDTATRNKLLEDIGTNQFEWRVEAAEKEEKKQYATEEIKHMLPDAEFTMNWSQYPEVCSLKYDKVTPAALKSFVEELIEAADEAGAPAQVQLGYNDIYGRIMKMPQREKAEKDTEAEKEYRQRQKRKQELKGMKDRIEERVCRWIGKISEERAKKKEEEALPLAVEWLANGYSDIDSEDVLRIIGREAPENTIEDEYEYNKAWAAACKEEPHRILIVCGLLAMLPSPYAEWWGYNGEYNEESAEGIKAAYKYLHVLGYEAADEELDFVHGASNLYYHSEEEN